MYTIPTDLRNKPVRHLFYRMGPKIRKKDKFSVFSILPDAWKNHASGNYRTHGYEKKIMRPVITGRMIFKKIMRPVIF